MRGRLGVNYVEQVGKIVG